VIPAWPLQADGPGGYVRNHIWTGTCAAVLGLTTAAVLGAQTTATSTQQTPPQAPPAATTASAEKTIVVTGCLRPASGSASDAAASTTTAGTTGATTAGTAGTAGTTGTAGATTTGTTGTTTTAPAPATGDDQQKFILTDAGISAADAGTTSTAGAAAATTAAPANGPKETYRLIANGSALSPHVNKKLELTGTLEANSATATDSASGPEAGRPTLRVKSGRIVAASCDQK
jgi:hypothetical protein